MYICIYPSISMLCTMFTSTITTIIQTLMLNNLVYIVYIAISCTYIYISLSVVYYYYIHI